MSALWRRLVALFRRDHCVMLGCPRPPDGRGALCREHRLALEQKLAARVAALERERSAT